MTNPLDPKTQTLLTQMMTEALKIQDLDRATLCLQKGADPLGKMDVNYASASYPNMKTVPIFFGICHSHFSEKSADFLLAAGADLEARGVNGETALKYVTSARDPKRVLYLLGKGANVLLPNDFNKTALDEAQGLPAAVIDAMLKSLPDVRAGFNGAAKPVPAPATAKDIPISDPFHLAPPKPGPKP